MQRIAFGRIVGLVIALAGIGVSIWCARDALRMSAEVHQWLVARPMQVSIDLSQPSEITTPFHQTCSSSHAEALYLQCDVDAEQRQNVDELFKDLSGTIVIKDSVGNEIETATFGKGTVHFWDGATMLASFAPFRRGDYVATIRIDSGVPALAGKPQVLYVKYELCGLERLPTRIMSAFAFGAGLIGLVSAVCVLPGLLRHGIWRSPAIEVS